MDCIGSFWKALDDLGRTLKALEVFGRPWKTLEGFGKFWKTLDIVYHGILLFYTSQALDTTESPIPTIGYDGITVCSPAKLIYKPSMHLLDCTMAKIRARERHMIMFYNDLHIPTAHRRPAKLRTLFNCTDGILRESIVGLNGRNL